MVLWVLLTDMFGAKWVNAYGAKPDPNNVWATSLANVTPEQIKTGLKRLSDSGTPFVPTLPEFKALCLEKTEQQRHREFIQQEANRKKALPKPASRETSMKEIQKIKKMLRMK